MGQALIIFQSWLTHRYPGVLESIEEGRVVGFISSFRGMLEDDSDIQHDIKTMVDWLNETGFKYESKVVYVTNMFIFDDPVEAKLFKMGLGIDNTIYVDYTQ